MRKNVVFLRTDGFIYRVKPLRLEASLDGFRFGFVTGLAEEGKHILLVGFDTGLVEGIDVEQQTAHAAGPFEEVDELTEVVLVEFGHHDAQVGHTTVHVGQLGAEFGHLVHLIHAFAGQEVEAVEVFFIVGEKHGVAGLLHGDDGFEDAAFALLDPLSHRVEVGGKVHSGREDAHTVLALTLAVELLPPFVHEVEFRLEVHEDFNLLSGTIEGVAHGGILRGHIVFVGALCFHVGCTLDEGVDVETGAGDGEQPHGGEHRSGRPRCRG